MKKITKDDVERKETLLNGRTFMVDQISLFVDFIVHNVPPTDKIKSVDMTNASTKKNSQKTANVKD